MLFAEVAVDTYQDPVKRIFTYQIPEKLTPEIREGLKVVVPFGKRIVEGYLWKITRTKPNFPVKEIKEVKGTGFTRPQVALARWMADYYLAAPLDCLKCQIPGRGERVALGKPEKITTLLLIPSASQIKLRAATSKTRGVLIGSRSAVFSSLPNLKKIVVEEPENWNYKNERAPYYHTQEVAKKRAELENLELELRYSIPRVEDLKKEGTKVPKLKLVKIIDLKKEKSAGNYSRISQTLENLAKNTKSTIVYTSARETREKVKEELRKIGADQNVVEVWGPGLFSLMGGQAQYVVWADPDTLLNLPDFRAHEKLVWAVWKLGQIATQKLCLQTNFPDHPLFKELETGNLKNFYQRELKDRRRLHYPPFSTLVKLTYTGKSTAKVNLEAERLQEKLLASDSLLTTVSPPYPPYAATPDKTSLNIAIKVPLGHPPAKLLKEIGPDWKVEVDPETLL